MSLDEETSYTQSPEKRSMLSYSNSGKRSTSNYTITMMEYKVTNNLPYKGNKYLTIQQSLSLDPPLPDRHNNKYYMKLKLTVLSTIFFKP